MSIRVGRYLIYRLIDPRDRSLKYIGKTIVTKEVWRRPRKENAKVAVAARMLAF